MRVMVLGAGGFIGRHIISELLVGGHEVTAVVRSRSGLDQAFPQIAIVVSDLARDIEAATWLPRLVGIDVVVNASGVLRGRDLEPVHVAMPRALHAACGTAGVQRVVLISAISARADVDTDYSASKLLGEEVLRQSGVRWTILRPSLVYGDGSYGGTSLLRGLAGLPIFTPIPGDGSYPFTPIHARDLARTVRLVCEGVQFEGATLEPVGPETMSLKILLARYRAWLGFGAIRFLPVPLPVMRLLGRLGDILGGGPIATNSLVQMIAGNAGDSAEFASAIGFEPLSLGTALMEGPAQVQDRWHARLFFLAPALKTVLLLMWIASALLGLFFGRDMTAALVAPAGLPEALVAPLQVGSSVLDLVVAAVLVLDRKGHIATALQLAVVLGYTAVIGLFLPHLWLDPLGSLIKNFPVMLAILVHGAIGDRR